MREDLVFLEAIESLPTSMRERLGAIPMEVKKRAREVRIRAGRPVVVELGAEQYCLSGKTSTMELAECFRALCGYSVHSHTEEIRQGFLTVKGGHRAGLCGTAVYQEDVLYNVRDISSINLRIAREMIGVSDSLFAHLGERVGKLLLVGAPASGKTTLLRDCVRKLTGSVSLIDTRGELASSLNGVPQKDVGNADVFSGFRRADGMLCALRTMAPDYIVCDEIGSREDATAVSACVGGGVQLIATVHAGSLAELWYREELRTILNTGAFETLVLLTGKSAPCRISNIFKAGDHCACNGGTISYDLSDFHRIFSVGNSGAAETGTARNHTDDRMVLHRNKVSGTRFK